MNKMNDMPLVSIVTPAYNAEKFIEDTLKSVKCQMYPNIEHVVIDDGSTDKTAHILKRHEGIYNLKCFSKLNEGQAITVNKGFNIAKGEIVVWLNADDVLFSRYVIADVVEAFRKKLVDVVYGHMAIIDEENKILKIQYVPPRLNFNILSLGHFAACIFYRREILSRYKLDPTLNYALDYDQCLRMAKDQLKFGYINETLIAWRRHKTAKSIKGYARAREERRYLKQKYDIKPNLSLSFHYKKFLIFLFILARKIYGVKEVVKFYKNGVKLQLAFDAKFDSLPKFVVRQVIPFV